MDRSGWLKDYEASKNAFVNGDGFPNIVNGSRSDV